MNELLSELLRRADAGECVAVCVVVTTHGSTPQKAGATMLVLSNGQSLGTLGGGCVEAEVRTRALRLLTGEASARSPALISFKLDNDYGWDDGLVCGGSMRVAVTFVDSPETAQPWREAMLQIDQRQTATVPIHAIDEQGVAHTFEHTIAPPAALVIAGAGHVAAALARVVGGTDFQITVIDDRPDFANADRFPGARCVIGEVDLELARTPIDPQTFVVIVTRGHRRDAAALAAVIASPARYIGLIGSKRKIVTILRQLKHAGATDAQLARVHAPIGLSINAVTPDEIAISIAAELIAVRRQRDLPAGAQMKFDSRQLQRAVDRAHGTDATIA